MAKRGSIHLGLVSIVIAVVGAAGLAACGSDDDSGSGGGGGSSAGKGGAGGKAEGGSTTAGSSGSHAGATNVAGTSPGGAAGGGGDDTAGAAGEAGSPSGGSPAGGSPAGGASNTGGAGNGGGGTTSLTPSDALKTHSPLPALPADTTNALADNAAAATFGQKLFFDKRYSGPLVALTVPAGAVNPLGNTGDTGKVACATCHMGPAMSDNRDPFNVTLGTNFHTRNAPALVNSSFYTWTNWAGRFSAQWELPLAVAENAVTMNSNRLKLAHFIYDHYKADYEAVFSTTMNAALAASAADAARFPAEGKPKAAGAADGAWEGMTGDDQKVVNRIIVNFGKALQAYFRMLVSRDAPFDQYITANGGSAISESAKRGGELFVGKANCSACHSGPTFTDNQFHNLGVRQDNTVLHEPATDNGRFTDAVTLLGSALNSSGAYSDDAVAGAARLAGLTNPMPASTTASFRTASLREVGDTAPYMHSGQLATLADVVKFYVAGGGTAAAGSTKDPALVPLTLSAAEQADLVEFLKTLSGAAVPAALLVDTSGQ
ncbi:MAG TPA: cytochrome c peroxidase [Polyangiaceae bacterium]|jgi:cytochrome c peroxidase